MRPHRPQGDGGQISLLILVSFVVAAALVLVAGAVTQVHLGRQQLRSLADAAALDGADALDTATYYAGGASPGDGVPISDASVLAAAAGSLAASAPASSRLTAVAVAAPTGTTDRRTAEVTLTGVVHPWLLPRALGQVPAVTLTVTSRARGVSSSPERAGRAVRAGRVVRA